MAIRPIPAVGQQAGMLSAQLAQNQPQTPFTDPTELERKRRLAEMLSSRGFEAPARSGIESAGNLAQILSGAFIDKQAGKKEGQNAQNRQEMLKALLSAPDQATRQALFAGAKDPAIQSLGLERTLAQADEQRGYKREDEVMARRRSFAEEDREDMQQFQSGESLAMRGFQGTQAERDRAFRAEQNRLDRGARDEAARAKAEAEMAKQQAKLAEKTEKEQASLRTLDRTTDTVVREIDKALSLIDPGTTGLIGEATKGIGGSKTFTLNKTLDTIKANVAFGRLQQMRAESPTGGALGNVSNIELDLLGSVEGSLALGQRTGAIRENLKQLRDKLQEVRAERLKLMESGQGDDTQIADGATAVNPETGQRIVYRNGQWEALQ